MFGESDQGQMDMDSGAVLPTDPIRAETCFNNFVPFFTTPDADASTSGAFRSFVFPDASPNFEVGSTKEFGFSINASDMVSWPNSFLQFSFSLDMGDGKTNADWIGRLKGMGVKVMPDLKMIFDKIDLLINESPFQTITEFPKVNFIRSNILGGSQQWIKIVQGGSYVCSPELKTNSLEMGSGTSSHKIVSQPSCSKNYNIGSLFTDHLNVNNIYPITNYTYAEVNHATRDSRVGNIKTSFVPGVTSKRGLALPSPLEQWSYPKALNSKINTDVAADKAKVRSEVVMGENIVYAPDEDIDLIDALERGDSIFVQIPMRDLFSSLSSIQWMPGAIFRRINFRFHIKSNPSEYLLGFIQNKIFSSANGGNADFTEASSLLGMDKIYYQTIRPRIEDIKFKFDNAKMYFWGQRFSPALITELKSYLDSKGSMQAVWYQAYMYYRVLRVLHNSGNVIDQNFTTISPGSAWLLCDPWHENSNAYKQRQRIMIPSVCKVTETGHDLGAQDGTNCCVVSGKEMVNSYKTFNSFIPISPIANKLIQRSYIAINGREFPPVYEEQHWRLMSQPSTVHSALGFSYNSNFNVAGQYGIVPSEYTMFSNIGSVFGRNCEIGYTQNFVYYPPYFEAESWLNFDQLNLIYADGVITRNLKITNQIDDVFEAIAVTDANKKSIAFSKNFFYNADVVLPAKKVRLEENYLRYLMTTGFHIDPFQSQSTLIGYEQWNTLWPIISFPIGSQDSATGAPLYEATAMTGRLHIEKESESVGISLPYYLIIQEAYLSAITADGSIITMIGTA